MFNAQLCGRRHLEETEVVSCSVNNAVYEDGLRVDIGMDRALQTLADEQLQLGLDPQVTARVDSLFANGGPLAGLE